MKQQYRVIGVMSGTSLDGLDIASCIFTPENDGWQYTIEQAQTVSYTPAWKKRLANVESLNALDLAITHADYGHLIGSAVNRFIRRHHLRPDFIASHGHTIFHQPSRKMTLQIGDGAAIAAETGLPVVCDFRTNDVALGGQGAPLVPAGDRQLFHQYAFCLNLGGFANVSYESRNKRIAFDICPVNIVLNRLAGMAGKDYDKDGLLASRGQLNPGLLEELNSLPYYSLRPPKSLGKEWVLSTFNPVIDRSGIPLEDKLHTVCHHMAGQIAKACSGQRKGSILVTGGGAYNRFLIDLLRKQTCHEPVLPDDRTISFKEALIFAFLGVLRVTGQSNTLRSVTGASRDAIGGAIYAGKQGTHEL